MSSTRGIYERIAAKGETSEERKSAFYECEVIKSEEVPTGAIPLSEKLLPTQEALLLKAEQKNAPCVTCYGRNLNIAPLQDKLREGEPHGIWTAEGQATNDLSKSSLRRAYHDSLGIEKIIFAFSDDLLTQSFRMPWWYSWGESLLFPLFRAVGVNPDHIVRCLLAKMPPDCLIDVHHDTGRWTTRTHRMHIPIFTNVERVAFLTGPTAESMKRIEFPEAVCFELNNRAKHAVYNGWDVPRVHLIFDWVENLEEEVPKIIFRDLTEPDRGVIQFRRSLWYYDENRPSESFPAVPDYVSNSRTQQSAFRKLVQLAGIPSTDDQLYGYIHKYDLGEILFEPLENQLQTHYPKLFEPANKSSFAILFAECLTDKERRFSWESQFSS